MSSGETTVEAGHLEGVDGAGTIKLTIDVHNDEGDKGHFLVWNTDSIDGKTGEELEELALINTESDEHEHFHMFDSDEHEHEEATSPGKGSGTYWGVTLSNATLTSATTGEVKFEEE